MPGVFQRQRRKPRRGVAETLVELFQARPGLLMPWVRDQPGLPIRALRLGGLGVVQTDVPVHGLVQRNLHASSSNRQCISALARCLRTVLTETPMRTAAFS